MSTRKSSTNNGFLIFTDQLGILENIPDENVGKAIKLLLKNFETMEHISEDALTNTVYELIATNIRRYRQESIIATEHGKLGGNPTLNPTLKGTLNPTLTLPLSNNTRQDNTIQDKIREEDTHTQEKSEGEKLYGTYANVLLTYNNYKKLQGICLSDELLETVINELSEAIEIGRYDGYKKDHPNAHYVLLQKFIKNKRNNPRVVPMKPQSINDGLF